MKSFASTKKNVLITMSGGATTVINSTLYGILSEIRTTKKFGTVYAGYPGLLGVFNDSLVNLSTITDKELHLLKNTPGAGFIGTTRVRTLNTDDTEKLRAFFIKYNIGLFINIGGNGTIQQTKVISKDMGSLVDTIALPKTIDNDLGDPKYEQVYFTPGFPTCVNYWKHKIHFLNQENLGAYSHDKVIVVQTAGRRTGFIAGATRIVDQERKLPLILLLPEDQRPLGEVLEKIQLTVNKHRRAIVVLAEGYTISDFELSYDSSGQVKYSSSESTMAQELVNKLKEIGIPSRHSIPGIDQRSDITYVTSFDRYSAISIGVHAIRSYLDGKKNFFMSNGFDFDIDVFKISVTPLSELGYMSRTLPDKWIDKGNFDVTDDYIEYLLTLVDGEVPKVVSQLSPLPILEEELL